VKPVRFKPGLHSIRFRHLLHHEKTFIIVTEIHSAEYFRAHPASAMITAMTVRLDASREMGHLRLARGVVSTWNASCFHACTGVFFQAPRPVSDTQTKKER
jgi:hypothetical protein